MDRIVKVYIESPKEGEKYEELESRDIELRAIEYNSRNRIRNIALFGLVTACMTIYSLRLDPK